MHTACTSARYTRFHNIPHMNVVETHLQSQWHVELLVWIQLLTTHLLCLSHEWYIFLLSCDLGVRMRGCIWCGSGMTRLWSRDRLSKTDSGQFRIIWHTLFPSLWSNYVFVELLHLLTCAHIWTAFEKMSNYAKVQWFVCRVIRKWLVHPAWVAVSVSHSCVFFNLFVPLTLVECCIQARPDLIQHWRIFTRPHSNATFCQDKLPADCWTVPSNRHHDTNSGEHGARQGMHHHGNQGNDSLSLPFKVQKLHNGHILPFNACTTGTFLGYVCRTCTCVVFQFFFSVREYSLGLQFCFWWFAPGTGLAQSTKGIVEGFLWTTFFAWRCCSIWLIFDQ